MRVVYFGKACFNAEDVACVSDATRQMYPKDMPWTRVAFKFGAPEIFIQAYFHDVAAKVYETGKLGE